MKPIWFVAMLAVMACVSLAQDAAPSDGSAEVQLVRLLNQKLSEAAQARDVGDWKKAIALLEGATELAPDRDLLWFNLGDAYRGAKKYQDAATAYNRAISIKAIAPYYNNLGEAESKLGNVPDAVQAYRNAAQLDPEKAWQYYFNIGAVETNAGDFDAANAAYDDAIRADPSFSRPYYFKGLNLLSNSQTVRGQAEVPPEAVTLFEKYLELSPDGPYADMCHKALDFISRDITTTYRRGETTDRHSAGPEDGNYQSVAPRAMDEFVTRRLQPAYPTLAREARIQGTVTLLAVIEKDGSIASLDVFSGNPFLVEAALDAVQGWKYKPYKIGRDTSAVCTQIQVNFALTPDTRTDLIH
jgi:TonB family protein